MGFCLTEGSNPSLSATKVIADVRTFIRSGVLTNNVAGSISSSSTTSISNGTFTPISMSTTNFLRGGMTVGTYLTGNTLIVPTTGIYAISGSVGMASSGGVISGNIYTGALSIVAATNNSANGGVASGPVSTLQYLTAGTAVGIAGFQNSGSTVTTYNSGAFNFLNMTLISI